jgi:hypothetical protein
MGNGGTGAGVIRAESQDEEFGVIPKVIRSHESKQRKDSQICVL